ncbi:PadR family transcriptional regulator [Actinoplanes xinjiangensis]|jgi:DNA-binding PadR family transcriptional regulator|uniref:PadR family transcriptional regulator n=1 Tax=Actinoplanes xinjiangensis TaxID=512350 RepID=UPI00342CB120
MRETTFLILTALADQPRHGYGIIQEVAVLSGGRVALLPGTLYTALDRLTAQGLVELSSEEIVDGRLRRNYRLRADGRAELARQSERLRGLAAAADSRLSTPRPRLA